VVEKALKPGKKQCRLKDRLQFATGETLGVLYNGWHASVSEEYGSAPEGADRMKPWSREHMQLGRRPARQRNGISRGDRLASRARPPPAALAVRLRVCVGS